ncbi:MAG: tripartite tricarboxylate transporter TctB family protein [Thermodesulfobacteriota bacterium]|nr:tripartite tricarboxylate transporter TctB family protein [Thermodesulfobacteriota bacterium]
MRVSGKTIMSLVVVIIAGWAVIDSLKWPFKTAFFPMAIGIPVIIMGIIDLFFNFMGKEAEHAKMPIDSIPLPKKLDPTIGTRRAISISLWIFGFFLMVIFLGFSVAIPLFVFLYLKIQGKEGWGITIALTVLVGLFFYGLFVWFIDLHFPEGWLFKFF